MSDSEEPPEALPLHGGTQLRLLFTVMLPLQLLTTVNPNARRRRRRAAAAAARERRHG